jgi:predicted transcriptional regulator
MSLSKLKKDLHKLIDQIDDEYVLKEHRKSLKAEAKKSRSWWDELTDGQKTEVQESLDELDRGEGIPHEEVMKKYKKWL